MAPGPQDSDWRRRQASGRSGRNGESTGALCDRPAAPLAAALGEGGVSAGWRLTGSSDARLRSASAPWLTGSSCGTLASADHTRR